MEGHMERMSEEMLVRRIYRAGAGASIGRDTHRAGGLDDMRKVLCWMTVQQAERCVQGRSNYEGRMFPVDD